MKPMSNTYTKSRAAMTAVLLTISLPGAALFAGCGSGSKGPLPVASGSNSPTPATTATGRATFTVRWPERSDSRLLPLASNSIRVVVKNGQGKDVGTVLLVRPASGAPTATTATATLPVLPVGTLAVTATAYPNADGSGVAQASGAAPLTVQANQNSVITLTMDTTIDRIDLAALETTLPAGSTTTLTATPRNAAGEIVLTTNSQMQYATSAAGVAGVTGNGLTASVRGVGPGEATLTVTDAESGKSGQVTVTITPQQAQSYSITYMGPVAGYNFTLAQAINNKAEVAGTLKNGSDEANPDHLYIWRPNPSGSGGQSTDHGAMPGFTALTVTGINDNTEVCGNASRFVQGNVELHAFVWKNGQFTDLGLPGFSEAGGINNAGKITGFSSANNLMQAIVWQNGQFSYLDVSQAVWGTAITDNDVIAGYNSRGGGFLLRNGTYNSLNTAVGFLECKPLDVNAAGLTVGYQVPLGQTFASRACFWLAGESQPVLLDPLPGAEISAAKHVNNSGTIIGYSILPTTQVAVRWNVQQSQPENLNNLVPELGANSTLLQTADGINEAGQIISSSFNGGYLLTPQP